MRPRQRLLWLLFIPVILLVAVVVLAMMPSVQTFSARQFLAGQKDFRADLARLAASTDGLQLDGLSFEQPGIKLTLPKLTLSAPLISAARGGVQVRTLSAKGWVLEIDPAAMPASPAPRGEKPVGKTKASAPFEGLFSALRLPAGLVLDGVDISGEIHVKGAKPIQAKLALAGGGISAGHTGKLSFTADATSADGPVTLNAFVHPAVSAHGALEGIAVMLNGLVSGVFVRGELEARHLLSGSETYALSVHASDQLLFEAKGEWQPGAKALPLQWKAQCSDTDLASLAASTPLPAFKLTGEGTAQIGSAAQAQMTGALKVLVSDWKRVPQLAGRNPGELKLDSHWDLGWADGLLSVRQFQLALDGAAPLRIEAVQPFVFDPAHQHLHTDKADLDVLRVELAGLKPEVLAPFLPPDLKLTSAPLTLGLTARPEGEGLRITLTEDLLWPKLHLTQADTELLALDELRWRGLSALIAPGDLQADLGHLTLKSGDKDLLALTGKVTQNKAHPLSVTADISSALPELLANIAPLKSGQLTLHTEATLAEPLAVKATLRTQDLTAKNGSPLPEISLNANVSRTTNGTINIAVPVKVINRSPQRTSDLELVALITPATAAEAPIHTESSLHSEALYVSDLTSFSALVPCAKPKPNEAKQAPESAAATGPRGVAPAPWAKITGSIDLDLGKVVYAPGMEFTQVKSTLELKPATASLSQFSLQLGKGSITASGILHRSDAAYMADAKFAATGIAITPLLESVSPSTASMASGTLNLQGTLSGSHRDYASVFTTAPVNLQVDARNGEISALSFPSVDKVSGTVGTLASTAGKALGFLQKIGGQVGKKVPVNKSTTEALAKTEALVGVHQALSRIGYDQFRVALDYLPEQAVNIHDFNLTSPTLQLTGAGKITLGSQSITNSPLSLKLALAARGDLSRQLSTLSLMDNPSPSSYTPITEPLEIDGTLNKIGTQQLERWLRRSLPKLR